MDGLLLLRAAHVLSAAIIFGTGLGIVFFTWFGYRAAVREGAIGALRQTLRLTLIADVGLIAPAAAFQAASGFALMEARSWSLASAWSVAVWDIFAFAGVCWLLALFILVRLARGSREAPSVAALPARFHRRFRLWLALGALVYAAVIVIYWLMVAKPLTVSGV